MEDPATRDDPRRSAPHRSRAPKSDAEIRIPKATDALGRISAQTAKQVIFQKVREAERETIFDEYSGRVGRAGQLHRQAHRRTGSGLDLGKTEARLPKKEQSRLESFSVGRPRSLRDQERG